MPRARRNYYMQKVVYEKSRTFYLTYLCNHVKNNAINTNKPICP